MIEADDLAHRLADLEPIGRDERGTTRLAWTPEERSWRRVVPAWSARPLRSACTRRRAASPRTTAKLTVASRSDGVTFDADLRAALGDAEGVVCFAGHDAGILAECLPAAMVLTRNPSGVSHSPEETADLDDAAAAANAILGVLQ